MLHSALNFAVGFFGLPVEGRYLQSVTIEKNGVRAFDMGVRMLADLCLLQFNNTLAPYDTCPNAKDRTKSDRGVYYVNEWASVYLKDAHARLAPQLKGYDLSIEDIYIFQQVRILRLFPYTRRLIFHNSCAHTR